MCGGKDGISGSVPQTKRVRFASDDSNEPNGGVCSADKTDAATGAGKQAHRANPQRPAEKKTDGGFVKAMVDPLNAQKTDIAGKGARYVMKVPKTALTLSEKPNSEATQNASGNDAPKDTGVKGVLGEMNSVVGSGLMVGGGLMHVPKLVVELNERTKLGQTREETQRNEQKFTALEPVHANLVKRRDALEKQVSESKDKLAQMHEGENKKPDNPTPPPNFLKKQEGFLNLFDQRDALERQLLELEAELFTLKPKSEKDGVLQNLRQQSEHAQEVVQHWRGRLQQVRDKQKGEDASRRELEDAFHRELSHLNEALKLRDEANEDLVKQILELKKGELQTDSPEAKRNHDDMIDQRDALIHALERLDEQISDKIDIGHAPPEYRQHVELLAKLHKANVQIGIVEAAMSENAPGALQNIAADAKIGQTKAGGRITAAKIFKDVGLGSFAALGTNAKNKGTGFLVSEGGAALAAGAGVAAIGANVLIGGAEMGFYGYKAHKASGRLKAAIRAAKDVKQETLMAAVNDNAVRENKFAKNTSILKSTGGAFLMASGGLAIAAAIVSTGGLALPAAVILAGTGYAVCSITGSYRKYSRDKADQKAFSDPQKALNDHVSAAMKNVSEDRLPRSTLEEVAKWNLCKASKRCAVHFAAQDIVHGTEKQRDEAISFLKAVMKNDKKGEDVIRRLEALDPNDAKSLDAAKKIIGAKVYG